MASILGKTFQIQLFGESHQPFIGVTINNIASGITLDIEQINKDLSMRRPKNSYNSSRKENDEIKIISGYFNNKTTGAPLTILIPNNDVRSDDYNPNIPRPSHADLAAYMKYNGYNDYRGGGHFSARLSVGIVVAGSIAKSILRSHNIEIKSHIKQVGNIVDDNLYQIEQLNNCDDNLPLINNNLLNQLTELIDEVNNQKDSIGGTIETGIFNVESGIGEPFFDSVESRLSHGLFSIPAVKGVEFGLGCSFNNHHGSTANDEIRMDHNKITTITNNNGGINGGITNGMPILFKTTFKPIPSIAGSQKSIDLNSKTNTTIEIKGRHDSFVLNRAIVIVESIAAITMVDLYSERYGYLWQNKNMD